VSVVTPLLYMIVLANVARLLGHATPGADDWEFAVANFFVFMSGGALVKPNFGIFIHPLPWLSLALLVVAAAAILALTNMTMRRQSY
jgi:hypothetical protein